MNPIRVLVADDDEDFSACMADMMLKYPSLHLAGQVKDGREALQKTIDVQPDFLLINGCMPYLDGFAVVDQLTEILPDYHPIICILSTVDLDAITPGWAQEHVCYFMRKPVDAELLIHRMLSLCGLKDNRSLEAQRNVQLVLSRLGCQPSTNSFFVLQESMLLLQEEPALLKHMTKDFYPRLAKELSTTPSAVERKLQYVVARLFTYGDLNKLYPFLERLGCDKEKPTNKQFLGMLMQELK